MQWRHWIHLTASYKFFFAAWKTKHNLKSVAEGGANPRQLDKWSKEARSTLILNQPVNLQPQEPCSDHMLILHPYEFGLSIVDCIHSILTSTILFQVCQKVNSAEARHSEKEKKNVNENLGTGAVRLSISYMNKIGRWTRNKVRYQLVVTRKYTEGT